MKSKDHGIDKAAVVFLLLTGVAGSVFIVAVVKRICAEMRKNVEQEKLDAIAELAGAAAHEMRQPMTVVHNLMKLLHDKFKQNEPITEEEMDIINYQCERMNDIIRKMLNITSYKTKNYINGKKIVDLDIASMP
jgi:signal transduction histidine kinase